jgi:TonB-dependent receptor-like protein/carboxypeptidase family protein
MRRLARLLTVASLAVAPLLSAQEPAPPTSAPGRIIGHVVDAANGGPIPGAQVTVLGTVITAITDWTGRYALNAVPAGSYTVSVRMIGYIPKTVTGVNVPAGGAVPLDLTLVASAVEVAAVEVTAEMEHGSVARALNEQRNATGIMSAVTAEQIEKSPDSDAGQAVQRVSGVSVQDGKYVFVRGLGERYTTTSLNSARIPSPEPERKVVPLDLFPSGVLEAITTSKTFTPDQPGDFSGAQVNLRTREFDLGRVLSVSTSGSVNGAVSGRTLPAAPTVGPEWLGFAGAARALPSDVRAAGDLSGLSLSEQQALIGSFRNAWSARQASGGAGGAFSASIGGEDPVFGQRLGYLGSLSYGSGQEVRRDERRTVAKASGTPGVALPLNAMRGATGTASVLWGGILNLATRLGQGSRLSLNNTYTRSAENQATRLAGFNEQAGEDLAVTRLTFTDRSVASSQLLGQHLVGGRHLLEWTLSGSRVSRHEPDRSDLVDEAVIDSATGAVQRIRWSGFAEPATRRTFSTLRERGFEGGINFRLNLGLASRQSYVKLGAGYRSTDRDADTREYHISNFDLSDAERAAPAEQVFTQTSRLFLLADPNAGRYSATDGLLASYLQFDWALSDRARLVGGARVERSRVDVRTVRPNGTPAPPGRLRDTDLLPSLTLNLRVAGTQNLRLSASQTLSRPEYRELSPVAYRDVLGGLDVQGDPALRRALIKNVDARWEWYPSAAEVVSVALFAKHFDHPIERVIVGSTGFPTINYVNADGANNYGVELEVRKQWAPFTVFANATLMRSRIQPGNDTIASVSSPDRPMVGQAGYVVNGGLAYGSATGATTATLLYNVVGPRITEAGMTGVPDAYEQARHLIDMAVRTPLYGRMTLKLDLKNLLDAPVNVTQGGVTRLRYHAGRTASVGLTWEP